MEAQAASPPEAHRGRVGEPFQGSPEDCGRSRARTCGQKIKSLLLYQLSYAPLKPRAVYIANTALGQGGAVKNLMGGTQAVGRRLAERDVGESGLD